MATQTEESSPSLTAQVIGNAFVEQFYHILHKSPELVHRFYTDSSTVSRPVANGLTKTVTTMDGIKELILSLGTEEFQAEILSADAQASYMEGVLLLVTGLLTGKDGVSKKFIESFFLAPQDKGYYVLNDAFRFFDDEILPHVESSEVKDAEQPSALEPEVAAVAVAVDPPSNQVPAAEVVTENHEDASHVEAQDIVVTENGSAVKEDVASQPPADSASNHVKVEVVAEPIPENAPKKSYASIVKKENYGPAPVRAATVRKVAPSRVGQQPQAAAGPIAGQQANRAPPAGSGQQVRGASGSASGQSSTAAVPDAVAPESSSTNGSNSSGAGADKVEDSGYSVYIGGLPYDTTPGQVEEVFKKFGAIKRGGIQVRTNGDFCFGFVEFDSASSMEKAIEAKEIQFGDKLPFIQEKKTKTRVNGGGRGGGYRNDGFRGRGNFFNGGGRNGYGRRGEFSNGGRYGDNYPRNNQNGGGRGGNQNGGGRGGNQGGGGRGPARQAVAAK